MLILAIDTAAHLCSVALHDGASGRDLAVRSDDIGRGHAEVLMPMIAAVMDATGTGLPDLAAIAVTTGPGSFTGVRVGLAAAKGLAFAGGIPAIGIPVTDVIAADTRAAGATGALAVVLDARREAVYLAADAAGDRPAVSPAELAVAAACALVAGHDCLAGNGAPLVAAAGQAVFLPEARTGRAETLARLAAVILSGGELSSHPARPLYLRGADARPQDGFALPHAETA